MRGASHQLLPSRPRTLAGTISNNQISLNIAQLDRPSTSPVFSPLPIAHDFNKYNEMGFCHPGSQTGTIASDFAMLTTWLQISGTYGQQDVIPDLPQF